MRPAPPRRAPPTRPARGSRFKAGEGVGMGRDDTLYARAAGTVQFTVGRRGRVVSVAPDGATASAE